MCLPVDSEQWRHWQNTELYVEHHGLRLDETGAPIRKAVMAVLRASLSGKGYDITRGVMRLNRFLGDLVGAPSILGEWAYTLCIFGDPHPRQPWGWQLFGHHLCLNCFVLRGQMVLTPAFFGANPAEVQDGPRKGLRTLAGEEDLGIELIHTLDEQQQKVAIVDPTAYKDILTAASRKAALQGQPSGLAASKMNANQFDALMALMEEYARNVPDELAEGRVAQINKAGRDIHFAWSGGINRGDPHYYRVQTASFLIELDDTQDDANHIHSVWREFTGDFGEDLLHQHYHASHRKK